VATPTTETEGGVSYEFRVGDVFDRLAEIPDGSIDLIVTSPPFLALRSYLPADHPDKHKEIGSEPTPAEFIDTLLALSAEWGRVLAPHGSMCVELGDTYAGGVLGFQDKHATEAHRTPGRQRQAQDPRAAKDGPGWPLAKSLTGIPTLYPWSLAYGRNLLTGEPSPAGQWRIRNMIVWARPNPPVGALGDKFRPATSYITVACRGKNRYFDLDAVRTEHDPNHHRQRTGKIDNLATANRAETRADAGMDYYNIGNPAGAPPLDWHADDHPEDGDWLWKLSTQPYKGSHYACYPMALPKRLIEAMCPQRVCRECGKPSERVTERTPEYAEIRLAVGDFNQRSRDGANGFSGSRKAQLGSITSAQNVTTGWTDCGHDDWRTGIVLDPFAGSGTTIAAALGVGRHAIGIDIDARNAELARERVGMFLEVDS